MTWDLRASQVLYTPCIPWEHAVARKSGIALEIRKFTQEQKRVFKK
jgi:hypothetical protein